ncbi:MAG TPA: ATP-binding protein [Phycisphaeraceae bacterium]
MTARAPQPAAVTTPPVPQDELAQVIRAYNRVTQNLQRSHERLKAQVDRLRRELASTNAQLQRSKRLSALGEMAAGIAHEIRNPLGAIQLYAEMIAQDLDAQPPRAQTALENVRKIASAVSGLNAIVHDVLSFAREVQPRPCAVPADEVLRRVVEAHRPAIEAAQVQVEIHHPPGLIVWADPNLLHQALLNLVRNAVDAMAASPRRVLTLSADREEAAVILEVRDTGPGIAHPDIDRIFNPFFTTRSTGTGLGLAIVHRIVDAHGGAIAVHNDAGAVFRLNLPPAPHDAAAPVKDQDSEQGGSAA